MEKSKKQVLIKRSTVRCVAIDPFGWLARSNQQPRDSLQHHNVPIESYLSLLVAHHHCVECFQQNANPSRPTERNTTLGGKEKEREGQETDHMQTHPFDKR